MRAFLIEHPGKMGTFKQLPDPQPGPGEILVRVTVASVNPVDWKNIENPSHSGKTLPFIAGQDFAGVVEGIGNGVQRFTQGERICGIARTHGSYADYTILPDLEQPNPEPICKIPDDVGEADAAGLPTAGLTAYASLEWLGVRERTTVLIIGASGAVGTFATQLAKLNGAHVIGTAHSGSENIIESFGADEVIAYDQTDVAKSVTSKHPEGIDAVLDLANDSDGSKSLAPTLSRGGKIVSTIGSIDIPWFAQHGIEGKNLVVAQAPQSSHEGLRYLIKLVESGDLKVSIGTERSMQDASQALQLSKSGTLHGKILLTNS